MTTLKIPAGVLPNLKTEKDVQPVIDLIEEQQEINFYENESNVELMMENEIPSSGEVLENTDGDFQPTELA